LTTKTPPRKLASNRAYYRRNAEVQRKRKNEKWARLSVEDRLLLSAKMRAKRDGIPFNLELIDIKVPSHCPVLGIPLCPSVQSGHCPDAPSLDRIVPALGYTKGNVVVVSWRANSLKRDANLEEMRRLYEFYRPLLSA
jgi:hypothetical protein